jgi:ribosomal-protein-alanine N-acetyltransferase
MAAQPMIRERLHASPISAAGRCAMVVGRTSEVTDGARLGSDPGPLRVRAARPADLGALLALEQDLFAGDRLSVRSLRRFLRSATACLLVGEAGADLLGYALVLVRRDSRGARLYGIGRRPGAAGRGLGKALLQAAEQAARARERNELRLEVRSDNERAIEFYLHHGFHIFDRRPSYYEDGADALRMKKRLDE